MTPPATAWQLGEGRLVVFARNLVTRYFLIVGVALISLLVTPLNIQYLGTDNYGLWTLVASITVYFSVLELGYGGALVKFVAEYRARRDAQGLNEILSTLFYVFCALGVVVYAAAVVISFQLSSIFNLDADQARTGQMVLLIVAVNVAMHFAFSVYGGVINGFERYYINNVVGATFNVIGALVNVAVLLMGYGLVELVAATTLVRIVPYWIYRRNAHKVFPELRIRPAYFRRERLRELTGFSAYFAVIDWSARLAYTTDTLILGMFLNTTVVAVYAVGQKLADALHRMTNQLHTFLFPAIVHQAVEGEADAQRRVLVKATRFQLSVAVALCGAVATDADVLIRAWVGPGFDAAALVLRLLAAVVVIRTLMAMPTTLLKGTGHHKAVAGASAIAAVANLLLSIAAVKLFGMLGVAVATLVPTAALAFGFIFPRTCRVAGLPVSQGYRQIAWPALWPATVMVALMALTQHLLPAAGGELSRPVVLGIAMAHVGLGGAVYAGIFFLFGLDRTERQWFSSAVTQVWRRSFATA